MILSKTAWKSKRVRTKLAPTVTLRFDPAPSSTPIAKSETWLGYRIQAPKNRKDCIKLRNDHCSTHLMGPGRPRRATDPQERGAEKVASIGRSASSAAVTLHAPNSCRSKRLVAKLGMEITAICGIQLYIWIN